MRRTPHALAAVAIALTVGGLTGCDDSNGYQQGDPLPADSPPPVATPNSGLAGAGQDISPPPNEDGSGPDSGDEETGGD